MREIAVRNAHRIIIAAGDFNTLPSDRPNGIDNWVLNSDAGKSFTCPLDHINHELTKNGTYWYKGNWSFLDRIFIWSDPRHALTSLWETVEVVAHPWMLKDHTKFNKQTKKKTVYRGIPKRFNSRYQEGYSDHLPMVMSFIFEAK